MKAIGYIRVSTADQAEHGVSLDAQRARITAWATAADFELSEVFTDAGITGTRADIRPGLQAAIAAACDHRATLVVYSLSRFARNTREAIELSDRLHRAGANIVSLSEHIDTTSAAGTMVFHVLAALAQFESGLTSERVRESMSFAKSRGQRVGSIPFGYDLAADGRHLERNAAEQETISLIVQLRESGLSLRAIAAELQARGIVTKSGRATWAPKVIKTIIDGRAA